MNRFIGSSDEVCELVRQESDTVILAFSCGKDSVGAWLQLRRHFAHIVPFHLYRIPDLDFVEKSLNYYEEFFGQRIIRLPHPSLYRMLNYGVFQSPSNLEIIRRAELPDFDYDDIHQVIVEDEHLPVETFYGTGVRGNDSLARRIMLKHGCLYREQHKFYPIWDWSMDRLIQELRDSGVCLPGEYADFAKSFDGLDARFTAVIREKYPDDFAKIKAFFPLVEADIMRHEYEQKNY